jgi:hypothetical protein
MSRSPGLAGRERGMRRFVATPAGIATVARTRPFFWGRTTMKPSPGRLALSSTTAERSAMAERAEIMATWACAAALEARSRAAEARGRGRIVLRAFGFGTGRSSLAGPHGGGGAGAHGLDEPAVPGGARRRTGRQWEGENPYRPLRRGAPAFTAFSILSSLFSILSSLARIWVRMSGVTRA